MDARTEAIIHTLALIPTGKVCTYGGIAKISGYPGNARLVGAILKKLPPDSKLPWFRVINSQGRISFPEGSPKFFEQKTRLEEEGVLFLGNRCSLKKHEWRN